MSSLEFVENELKTWWQTKEKLTVKKVDKCCKILHKEAQENGLSEDLLNLISNFILKQINTCAIPSRFLRCLIPKTFMPDMAVRNILKWIVCHNTIKNTCVNLAFHWVVGLLDYGLANESTVNEFYYVFQACLHNGVAENYVCWLILHLTKPEDVDRNMVVKLLESERILKPKTINLILWCYKTYKPECVPESVAAQSVPEALKSTSCFKRYFHAAHERISAHCSIARMELQATKSSTVWGIQKRKMSSNMELIPPFENIQFGSQLYREKTYSVSLVNSWEKLSNLFLDLGTPSNVMSLLQNPYGLHILTFGNEYIQNRFTYTLHHTLQDILIHRYLEFPLEYREDLLTRLCDFQDYMQQGIPVISRFLSEYLPFWDGITYIHQIMRLLTWVTYSSFSEMEGFLLVHLYYVYISSNVCVKTYILRALLQFAKNLQFQCTEREGTLYIHSILVEDDKDMLQNLLKYLQNLCIFGLNHEPQSLLLLNEVLKLHESFLMIEEKAELSVKCILPPVAVYLSLFSRNYANIERLCNLLMKYTSHEHFQRSTRKNDLTEERLLVSYLNDFKNCLWFKKAFSDRKNGYIFRNVNQSSIGNVLKIVNVNSIFDIRKCTPLMILIGKQFNGNDRKRGKIFLKALRRCMPSFYNIVKQAVMERENLKSGS